MEVILKQKIEFDETIQIPLEIVSENGEIGEIVGLLTKFGKINFSSNNSEMPKFFIKIDKVDNKYYLNIGKNE